VSFPTVAQAATVSVPCSPAALTFDVANAPDGATLSLAKHCRYSYETPADPSNALPIIVRSLVIKGNGATIMRAVGAASDFRVFEVNLGRLTLDHVIVRNGHSASDGGGILVDHSGALTVTSSTITGNDSEGANGGGGIENQGDLTVVKSTISNNHADSFGGGLDLEAASQTNISRTTIAGNTAGLGGGVWGAGLMTMVRSTLTENTTADCGGGICLVPNAAQRIVNSRIIRNTEMWHGLVLIAGGGVSVAGSGAGSVAITNTTISHNLAYGPGDRAGGIFTNGTLTLSRTKVTRNVAAGTGPNAGGILAHATTTLHRSVVKKNSPNQCGSPSTVPGC
jgi:hypothetical protein